MMSPPPVLDFQMSMSSDISY